MEDLDKKINIFLSCGNGDGNGYGDGDGDGYGYGNGNGYGDGDGNGDGDGDGNGYGYGCGNGYGYGYGNGYGNGYGCGNGYGDGYGNGYGYGYGYGNGNGNGYGYGNGNGYGDGNGDGNGDGLYGLIINGDKINNIDHVSTIIKSVKGNFAKGFVVNGDLTLSPCYIAKSGDVFAHGQTIKKAHKALQEKILEKMPVKERIEKFLQEFKLVGMYPNSKFFEWHHILTGSCLFGRQQFCKNNGIDLNGEMTVRRFIELTQNDYGGEVIKELKKRLLI